MIILAKIRLAHRSLAAVFFLLTSPTFSDDWPMYRHDALRSGVTEEQLQPPLQEAWAFETRIPPAPAWPAPAKQDFWNEVRELRPVTTYDRAFHAAVADGRLYFGSSGDDQVYCLDAANGGLLWTFFAEAPVRLAPAIADGKAYAGSDDGWVYCLDARDGSLLWKHRPPHADRWLPGNGRVISAVPVRTGVLVDNGTAYYCAGLFPDRAVYRCALDAATGRELWCLPADNVSPQGYLIASPTRLFVPTGRTNPGIFARDTGAPLGSLASGGGPFAVLTDDVLTVGPGTREVDTIRFADAQSAETIASAEGLRLAVRGPRGYIQTATVLRALDRPRFLELGREYTKETQRSKDLEKQVKAAGGNAPELRQEYTQVEQRRAELADAMRACYLWETPHEAPYELVLAGNLLFAGGDGHVAAFNRDDGSLVWQGPVRGRAYGLAVSNGRLYVSTDEGVIHCFSADTTAAPADTAALPDASFFENGAEAPLYAEAANHILAKTGIRRGYCVVLDCGEGRLAYALAKQPDLKVVGLERDADKVARARLALNAAGLYGPRVTVRHWTDETLPYTTYMANLVVSDAALTGAAPSIAAAEVLRVLRPYGGVACIGAPAPVTASPDPSALAAWGVGISGLRIDTVDGVWAVIERGPVAGAGEWTQLYADSAHTACSRDPVRGPMDILWFGEPGPRDMVDRHHRPMSSLFKDGRLFIPGDNLVIAVDAYNGTQLWRREVPDSRRVGSLKNSGHMVLAGDALYVARKNECWVFDPATGEQRATFRLPAQEAAAEDWGYLDCVDDILLGTSQAEGASFDQLSKMQVNIIEGDFRPVIMSRALFGMDRNDGNVLWRYQDGVIMNDAVCAAEHRVYFIESRNETARANKNGRLGIKQFCESDTYLIALDLRDGRKLWERPVTLPFHHIMYLNGANGLLLASGSYNEQEKVMYGLFTFEMASGADAWQTSFRAMDARCTDFAGTGGSHGEQWQHPVIIDGVIYARPYAFDLRTGEKKEYVLYRGGHGCGGLTGSAYYLYGRGSNPRMYPTEATQTEGIPLTTVSRPGCWLNIIPAGGIIMIPESSSGCTCAYPLQTSIAFIPEADL